MYEPLDFAKANRWFQVALVPIRINVTHLPIITMDSLRVRAPKYPRGVPRDQTFGLKILVISSTNYVILWFFAFISQTTENEQKWTSFNFQLFFGP